MISPVRRKQERDGGVVAAPFPHAQRPAQTGSWSASDAGSQLRSSSARSWLSTSGHGSASWALPYPSVASITPGEGGAGGVDHGDPEVVRGARLAQARGLPAVEHRVAGHRQQRAPVRPDGEDVAVADLREHQPLPTHDREQQRRSVGDHGIVPGDGPQSLLRGRERLSVEIPETAACHRSLMAGTTVMAWWDSGK